MTEKKEDRGLKDISEAVGWLKCYMQQSGLSLTGEEETAFKEIIDMLTGAKTEEEMLEEERMKAVSRKVAEPDNQI